MTAVTQTELHHICFTKNLSLVHLFPAQNVVGPGFKETLSKTEAMESKHTSDSEYLTDALQITKTTITSRLSGVTSALLHCTEIYLASLSNYVCYN